MRVIRDRPRFLALFLVGIAALGAAAWYRHNDATERGRDSASTAAVEARLRALEAEEASLLAAVEERPDDRGRRRALAEFYRSVRRRDRYLEQLQEISRREPGDRASVLALARELLLAGQPDRAETEYRTSIGRWPQDAEAWQGLSAAFFHQGRFLQATQAARRAVDLKPDDPNNGYMLAISSIEYALQFPNNGGHDDVLTEGVTLMERIARVWPQKGDVFYRLGRARVALKQYELALRDLRRALTLTPERLDIHLELTRAHIRSGDRAGARKVVEAALTGFPENGVLQDLLGQLIQASGEPQAEQKALELFRKAVAAVPDNPTFWENLGIASLRQNRLDEARVAFQNTARLRPSRAFAYQQLAVIYTRQREPEKARESARRAAHLVLRQQQIRDLQARSVVDPDNVTLRLALADGYRELGLADAARDEYLLILSRDAGNRRARAGLAALKGGRTARPAA